MNQKAGIRATLNSFKLTTSVLNVRKNFPCQEVQSEVKGKTL